MKKFWKNLCLSTLAVVSAFSFGACNKSVDEVSVDLDGDGVISYWEELYAVKSFSERTISNVEIVEISTLAELKAINDKTNETKVYKLAKNIDCGGENIAINLGSSTLLGNNRVIKNFKLGDCNYYKTDTQEELIEGNIKGLIYNGVAVYDLRVFMGNQNITLNNTNAQTIISTFINVSNIDNVEVKGKLTIDRQKTDGLSATNSVDISMLNASIDDLKLSYLATKGLNVTNSVINGKIKYTEGETSTRLRIGGAVPHNTSSSEVYKVTSNIDMDITSSGRMCVGGIAGENDNMISTCSSLGEIKTTYTPNFETKLGGIVGSNNKDGEIKNCTSGNIISFDKSIEVSSKPDMYVGGIAGCNYGVLNYVTSDATMNINNAVKCQIGGIAGYSKDGIISNIISRGAINCNSVSDLYVSDMVGVSHYGYIETAVVTTNINVDNANITSSVKLGLVTMFEDFSIDAKYNADYSPNFSGIMVAGKTTIYMKPSTNNSNNNNFRYNLGLRNPFEYYVVDENTGEIKLEQRLDAQGNPVLDENGDEIFDMVTETSLPDLYNNLYLLESYSLEKYNISGDVKIKESLAYTYAKDSNKASIVSTLSSSRLQVNFFVRYLGFKYGLNHNEIDLSVIDLNQIKFTLSDNQHKVKYFEDKSYNGELEYYDRYLDSACKFDQTDEMYSLLYDLIVSNKTNYFVTLKVSDDFAKSIYVPSQEEIEEEGDTDLPENGDNVEPEESTGKEENNGEESSDEELVDTSLNLGQVFAENIQTLIYKMLKVRPDIYQLTSNKTDINEINGDENPVVKYMRLEFADSEFRYRLTFDVNKLIEDEGKSESSYLVNFIYSKVDKY